jgi:hypothetical protein
MTVHPMNRKWSSLVNKRCSIDNESISLPTIPGNDGVAIFLSFCCKIFGFFLPRVACIAGLIYRIQGYTSPKKMFFYKKKGSRHFLVWNIIFPARIYYSNREPFEILCYSSKQIIIYYKEQLRIVPKIGGGLILFRVLSFCTASLLKNTSSTCLRITTAGNSLQPHTNIR